MQPKSVDQIFWDAAQIASAGDRDAFLDSACAGDGELRRRVEHLLLARSKAEDFLERPAPDLVATVDEPTVAERPGTVIGPYKLLQQIGEGGMGTVFMAEQTHPVQRKVALKVIKPGMDSRQVIARFEAERQALALMDHVNIARVFDAGATAAGRPYFVMELVHGVPITKYCDDNHLTPRERLELFVPVCQAIQHAHQKGIIHRDVKPSNVMVTLYDGKPVPKVIDFGVAKATEQKLTERTLFTQYGTLVGTLEYMSPEQAAMSALGVDTRSDIFSLGVLLYELLTGSTPLTHKRMKEAAYAEILRMIKEVEPPRPSTRLSDSGEALASISAQRHMEPAKLTKLVRGELDWIVMKCLEKDRNRRYETASGFAADVQRYLTDEPVQACPPSVGYRFRKFARRNKRALAMVAVVAVAMLIAATTFGWAVRDREAREQEIAQETARKLALTEQGIRQALDRGTTSRAELHVILKRPGGVQQLLNQPARWELFIKTAHGELAQARRLAVRAEGSLDAEWTQAMDKLEQQLTSDQADYDLAQRLEKIRMDQATWVDGRFDHRTAAEEYSKAFAGFALLNDDPAVVATRLGSSPIKDQLVAALDNWAPIALFFRQESLAERLLALARQAAPDPAWGDRLRQLKVWGDQEALGKLVEEAPVTRLSPQMLALVGHLLPTRSALQESWLRRAQVLHPADFWLNFALGSALSRTQPLEATGFYRVALAVRPASSAVYNNLGTALSDQKKLPEAIAAYRKAIEIDPKHAYAHNNLGIDLRDQKQPAEAAAAFLKAIELNPNYARAWYNLGVALCDQKKPAEATAAFDKAIELDPKDALAYGNLGYALHEQKKLDEAIAAYRKAIELDPKFTKVHYNLGNALAQQKKPDQAIAAYRKAIELAPDLAEAHYNLGNALDKKGLLDEAIAAYRDAIHHKPELTVAHVNFGNALNKKGLVDEAIAAYKEAVRIDPKFGPACNNGAWLLATHPDPKRRDPAQALQLAKKAVEFEPTNGGYWQTLAWAQYRAGDWKTAVAAMEKVKELGSAGDSTEWFLLAMAHWQLGNKVEARKWYDQAVAWMDRHEPKNEELRRFRAEAEELLKRKAK